MTQDAQVPALLDRPPSYLGRSTPRICRARMFGVRAWLTVSVNNAEWQRRERVGLGALTRWDVLDGLLGLPLGLPVPITALTPHERQLLSRLPDGVVEHRRDV